MRLLLWLTITITKSILAADWEPSLSWYLYSKQFRGPGTLNDQLNMNSTAILEPSTILKNGRTVVIRPGDFRPHRLPMLHIGQLIHKSSSRAGAARAPPLRLKRKEERRKVWRGWRRVSGDVQPMPNPDLRPMARSEGRTSSGHSEDVMFNLFIPSLRALQRTTMPTPLHLPDLMKKPMDVAVGTLIGEDN
ncbi:hypothetical protein V3C99_011382 [Haemonchus contortus]